MMNAHLVVLCAVVALGSCTIGPAVNSYVGSVNGMGVLGNGIGLNRPILGVNPIGLKGSIGLPLVNGYSAPLVNGGIMNMGINGLAAIQAAQTANAISNANIINAVAAQQQVLSVPVPMPFTMPLQKPVAGLIGSPVITRPGFINRNGRSTVVNVKKNVQVLPNRW